MLCLPPSYLSLMAAHTCLLPAQHPPCPPLALKYVFVQGWEEETEYSAFLARQFRVSCFEASRDRWVCDSCVVHKIQNSRMTFRCAEQSSNNSNNSSTTKTVKGSQVVSTKVNLRNNATHFPAIVYLAIIVDITGITRENVDTAIF